MALFCALCSMMTLFSIGVHLVTQPNLSSLSLIYSPFMAHPSHTHTHAHAHAHTHTLHIRCSVVQNMTSCWNVLYNPTKAWSSHVHTQITYLNFSHTLYPIPCMSHPTGTMLSVCIYDMCVDWQQVPPTFILEVRSSFLQTQTWIPARCSPPAPSSCCWPWAPQLQVGPYGLHTSPFANCSPIGHLACSGHRGLG